MVYSIRAMLFVFFGALLALPAAQAQSTPPLPDTLEHRVAQMFMVTLHGSQLTEVGRDFLQEWQPGGVVLFTSNTGTPSALTRLTNAYQETIIAAGGPPLLIAIDQEGGLVQRLTEADGFTALPNPHVITASATSDMPERIGQLVAQELAAVGINMNLAPVGDMETNRENPIIRLRSFGNDPAISGEALAGYVRGLQSENVLATLKHFPGHGDTQEDSHVELPVVRHDRARLDAVEIAAFRQPIDAGAAVVMMAHIWYPALEPEANIPASLSHAVVTDLLRDELGFEGLIMTDAMDMDAIDTRFSYGDAAVRAVKAGVDIITAGPGVSLARQNEMMNAVVEAVQQGEISEARINESVERILRTKAEYGLMDWQALSVDDAAQRVDQEGHTAFLDELFRASVTLAYDKQGLIPLQPDQAVTVIFLATRYQIQHECSLYHDNIRWLAISDAPGASEIMAAQEAAANADAVVVFTQNAISNPQQQALVNALPAEKTIATAIFSPYDWQTYPDVSAYITTYSPMRPAVPAACALLFGAIPPQGQLAVTLSPELPAGSRAR